jgi:hypothetical protein
MKIFLIALLIIIFIIFIVNRPSTFSKTKGSYRLADLILYPEQIVGGERSTTYMLESYPESIAVKYIFQEFPCLKKELDNKSCIELVKKKNDNNYINTKILMNIIKSDKEYSKYKKSFSNNELVLHVRIGDVLCDKNRNFKDNKTFPQIYSKYGDIEWWDNVKKYIKQNNINTIYLMYGSHTRVCLDQSEKYIKEIKDMFKDYKVVDINKNTADQDLMFSLNTRHFITTGGGYGLLIGELVEKNGGNFMFKPERTDGGWKNNVYFI